MEFTIDDSSLHDDPPMVTKCVSVIDELEDGKLITLGTLSERSGYGLKTLQSAALLIPEKYRIKVKHNGALRTLLGNERTVAEWLKTR